MVQGMWNLRSLFPYLSSLDISSQPGCGFLRSPLSQFVHLSSCGSHGLRCTMTSPNSRARYTCYSLSGRGFGGPFPNEGVV